MIIQIADDFDLEKTADSGQCFRIRKFEDGTFRFITGNHVLYISDVGDKKEGSGGSSHRYSVSCTPEEWQSVWVGYFDLDRCYQKIRESIPACDCFLTKAAAAGAGIRVLRQDHWETLISFIISQRKSIPAIKKSIELLCAKYGKPLKTPFETLYTFPSTEEMADIGPEDLAACKTGYRTGYILDAAERVGSGKLSLTELEKCSDQELAEHLMEVRGVGVKVASCVSLFSYGRTDSVPVDTWIRKVFDTCYNGTNVFDTCKDAGILQQYVFYYALKHKSEFA